MIVRWASTVMVIAAAAGCGADGSAERAEADRPDAPPEPGPAGLRPAIVFAGTSLTAGYGLADPSLAYPALLGRRLDSLGYDFRVVNAGVSGETSAGLLRRIEWVLGRGPVAVLVIETGANDGLRGQDPDSVAANIQAVIDRARTLDPPPAIVIAGMEALPNLGEAYVRRFRELFPELARTNDAALVPFLLAGVAGVDSLNQADGIHPTPAGQRIVADNVWTVLEDVIGPPPDHR